MMNFKWFWRGFPNLIRQVSLYNKHVNGNKLPLVVPKISVFREDYVDIMVADVLAPCVARTTMALTTQDKQVLVLYRKGFNDLCHLSLTGTSIVLGFEK